MKTIHVTETPTSFFLRADDLRAAFQCISTEQNRYYMGGVFIDTTDKKLVGLDGHQMLTIEMPEGCFVGPDCLTQPDGFIMHCDATDKAFKVKTVPHGDLWVYGDTATGILQFVAEHSTCPDGQLYQRVGVLEFTVIDGTFPDWRRVVPKGDGTGGTICYNPTVMAKLIKAADVIDKGRAIRITSGAGTGDPIKVEFAASHRMLGTLMPHKWVR